MISLVIASILCATTPVTVEEKSLKTSSVVQGETHAYKMGTEVVQTIRSEYADGSYTDFLKKMDSDYASAKKESALEGLIEIRKEGSRAQSFEDKSLKSVVEKHKATLDERLAKNYDLTDLNSLALGKIKPSTPAEKEAAAAVSRAQGALADLHRHLLDSLDEHGQTAQK